MTGPGFALGPFFMPMSLIGDIRITTYCATDLKGRSSLVALTGQIHFDLNYGPAGIACPVGLFFCRNNTD